jgi:hypothetical protein
MGTHSVRTAVTLVIAGLFTAGFGTASAAPAPADRDPGHPVLVDCFWKAKARPDAFILACGDGNSRLAGLRWSQWDDKAAVARGTSLVNDCKPYCAAGRFHSYPVEVRLEKPAPWKKNPQVKQYTQITLHFTDGRPSGYGKQVTYPLWG